MKQKFHYMCLFIIFFYSFKLYPQLLSQIYTDSIDESQIFDSPVKVTSIILQDNTHDLVITVGFPGNITTEEYPYFQNNSEKPLCGIFENGISLIEVVQQHSDHLPMDEWYRPAFNKYFNTHSGSMYTADFNFVKTQSGGRYLTNRNWQSYIDDLNNGTDSCLIKNQYQSIFNDICQKVYEDNEGFSGCIIAGLVTASGPDGTVYFSEKPVTVQRFAANIIHERMHLLGDISGQPFGFTGFRDRGTDKIVAYDNRNMFYSYDIMFHNGIAISAHSLYALPPIISHDLIFLGWIKPEEVLEININNYNQYDLLKLKDVNYPLTPLQIAEGVLGHNKR
jgi:hypothetical protein